MGHMEVEARGAQARVPQQQWDAAQVDARFEQMRREAVPEEMRIHGLGELGGTARLGAQTGDTHAGDGLGDAVPRKEPGTELIELPVAPQQRQQVGGEHHEAIAFPLALAYADDHALGVDVGALQLTEFGDADARGIESGQDHAMFQVAGSQQQRRDLVATEDDGEGLGLLGVGDILHHPWAAQGGLIEKAEGTHRLDEDALGDLLVEQMQLIGTDVLRAKAIG